MNRENSVGPNGAAAAGKGVSAASHNTVLEGDAEVPRPPNSAQHASAFQRASQVVLPPGVGYCRLAPFTHKVQFHFQSQAFVGDRCERCGMMVNEDMTLGCKAIRNPFQVNNTQQH